MSKVIDLTGQRFGKLTVIKRATENTKAGKARWICKCDCGNECVITGNNLRTGDAQSCGCMSNNLIDLTGKRFNHLTVIGISHKDRFGKTYWKCICDCGNECAVHGEQLRNRNQKSCGCDLCRPTIEKIDKRIIRIWAGMYSRCYNKKASGYKNYGGRGIKICDEWIGEGGCRHFYEWAVKNGYREDLTLDRIDTNGNYEPSNCRFSDWETQNNNRRISIRVLYEGKKMSPRELSNITGINIGTIYSKYRKEHTENGGLVDFTGYKPRDWSWGRPRPKNGTNVD